MSDRIEEILGDYLKPENFGLGDRFKHPVTFRDGAYFFDDFDRLDPEHYDCKSGAILAQKELKRHGIETNICSGQDELGIFSVHFYLRTPDKEIIDPTPMFSTFGAKHIAQAYHNHLDVETAVNILSSLLIQEENSIPLEQGGIVRFYDHGEKTYLTDLCAQPIIDDTASDSRITRIIHSISQFENGIPVYTLFYQVYLDVDQFLEVKDEIDLNGINRIGDLKSSRIGFSDLSGAKIDYKAPGQIEMQPYSFMLLGDLSEIGTQEYHILLEFTKNVLKSHL
jgi:hypothetical protein